MAEPKDQLDATLRELRKKHGDSIFIDPTSTAYSQCERVSTGSLSLDLETGGGLPYGRMVEYYGEESSGKSTMALKAVANVQKAGKRAVYIDVEHTFDPRWAARMGVNLETLVLSSPDTAEQSIEILEAVVRSGECGIVVLDSIAALLPQSELDKSLVDNPERLGERAKFMSRVIPRLQSALNTLTENETLNNCLILFINQIRDKIGIPYGDPTTTPGGRAVRFAASVRVKFSHGGWHEQEIVEGSGDKIKIGHVIKFLVKKNKTFAPYRTGEFSLYFEGVLKGQVDEVDEMFRYGQMYNLIAVNGRTYEYDGLKAVGKDSFFNLFHDDKKRIEKLRTEIRGVVKKNMNEDLTKS